jgi:hypothetical protein
VWTYKVDTKETAVQRGPQEELKEEAHCFAGLPWEEIFPTTKIVMYWASERYVYSIAWNAMILGMMFWLQSGTERAERLLFLFLKKLEKLWL